LTTILFFRVIFVLRGHSVWFHRVLFLVPTGGPVAIKTNLANDFSTWSTNLIALANCSNVYMKIGGVGMPIFALGKLSPRHQSFCL